MSTAEWLTRITAWLAFAMWSVVVVQSPFRGGRAVSLLWLGGSVAMFVHVSLAFQYYHQWSHTDAVVETARQTKVLTGINWGGGVWLNYLFSIVWMSDALWRVFRPLTYAARPIWLNRSVHVFLAFMWFNATVVFGSIAIQLAGIGLFVCVAVRFWMRPGK
jgi:hypothetical protein